jgi:FkbM family methyltransferase
VPAKATMAVNSSPTSEHPSLHSARSFNRPPDHKEASSLLAELAAAPCLFSPVSTDLPLALYGAGNLGRLAGDFLRTVGQDVTMVIDRNARRIENDPAWCNARLLPPAEVTDNTKGGVCLAISVATSPYVPLERSLFELGFKHIVPFYDLAESFRHLHPLSNGWFGPPLTANDQDNTAKVLARWDDDVSRAHHLQFLAWRRLREEWTFEGAPVPDCRRFFIPEITGALHDNETLLDAGAHHGGVTQAFVEQTQGAFRRIIAIEPDPSNRARLEEHLHSSLPDDPRVAVLDCALAEDEGEAPFHAGLGYASQLSDTGKMRVAVRAIDALDLSPSFTKLHLEGAELAALKGARQTLLANRPLVAATVYHNADGIWRTPLWLMETLPDYRFLFRVDSWCGTGAVIYAVPQERGAS